jgi:maleate isomerase
MDATISARIGVLVPSSNVVLERDAALLLPAGVSAHFARMKITRDDDQQLAALFDLAPAAADLLADAGVQAVAFGCTTGSLGGGLGYDQRIIERVTGVTGLPTTTTASALVEGLRVEGAVRLGVISPYEDWLNAKVVGFLCASGFEVRAVHGFGLPDPLDIAEVTPEQIANAVPAVDSDAVDAVVLACTAMRGVEAVALIGEALGKPVLTSNQVTYWKLLDMVSGSTARCRPSQQTGYPATAVTS